MTDEEIERIEALVVRASAWAASRPLVSALSALLADRKELLRSREWHMTASQRRKEQVAELRAQLAEAQAAQAHYDAWREVSARAQERAVAEAYEKAAKACEAHKPGHTLDLDGRLVDDLDGPWGLGSDFAAAIRALAPKATP